jgi:beta-ureidopropionase / N-carbamoyl-L-amino-acid hydrolase
VVIPRREFAAIVIGSLTSALGASRANAQGTATVRVNGARLNGHLSTLSQFGRNSQGGVSRVAYSQADIDARAAVAGWMREASLEVEIDRAGNVVGHRAGRDASAKPIVFGSHIDSVPEGGNYDGDVGAMAAIEVAQTLAERQVTTRHPIEVVVWTNEEGALYGSRAWSGELTEAEFANVSSSGLRIDEGIRRIGGDPERLADVRRAKGDIAAYFELHIEQGGILDAAHIDIGIVEGIVGICEWDVTVTGIANHAGTTPMSQRHDALLAAARFVEMVNRVVLSEPGTQVGTVGRIQAWPGAPNVIPGRVSCTLELRDLDDAKIARLYERIRRESVVIGTHNQTTFAFSPIEVNLAAKTDPRLREIVASAARELGLSTRLLPSGAGHDAQSMAQIGPIGMIFVPSVGGISHSPREFSEPAHIVNGANVLLGAILAADAEERL